MGFALVTDEIGEGRYTIQVDLGEAYRLQLIDAANAAIAKYTLQLVTAENNLATNAAFEAQLAVGVAEAVQLILDAQADDPNMNSVIALAALATYTATYKQYMSVVARNRPLRRTIFTLKTAIAQAQKQYNTWYNFQALLTKDAWCLDYTEGRAPGSYIATIEIEAEQDGPILLAEGARAWTAGDGTVLQSIKDANLATLNAQLTLQQARKATVEGKITTAEADEVALKAAYSNAVQNVIDAQTLEDETLLVIANANMIVVAGRLNDKRADIRFLKATLATVNASIVKLEAKIAVWTAKVGSANPVYGDGVLKPREFMSPEQAYFNAAILPGVQKYRPTYRRGTLTAINRSANTASVSLAAAYSEAQGLGINQASTLTGVEFEYMDCHHEAFEVDDEVVVKFIGQDWEHPKILGFIDHPRQCPFAFIGLNPLSDYFEFVFMTESETMAAKLMADDIVCEARVNGAGEWRALTDTTSDDTATRHYRNVEFFIGWAPETINGPAGYHQMFITTEVGDVPAGGPLPSTAKAYIRFMSGVTSVPTDPPDDMVEVRILTGAGALLCNFVGSEMHWAGSRPIPVRVKTTGQYKPVWGVQDYEIADDYVLFSEE